MMNRFAKFYISEFSIDDLNNRNDFLAYASKDDIGMIEIYVNLDKYKIEATNDIADHEFRIRIINK